MRILTAGGGSGGHVTPVVAVVHELRQKYPEAEIRFWCDKAFQAPATRLMQQHDPATKVETIVSGKFRRYHALAWWRQASRLRSIVWPNFRDLFKISFGTIQSLIKLIIWRPDVVFTKGGFVCLPIGVATRILGIKLVIHDSDAHPGLTNRILSRWADLIVTGAPVEYYPYDKTKMQYLGIPIKTRPAVNLEQQALLKSQLGFKADRPLIVVTGGGLGAQRINRAVADNLTALIDITSVALISGDVHYESLRAELGPDTVDFQLHAFVAKNFSDYMAAADVVVSRAGMTTLLELANLEKPSIIIPNIHLTGGHQQKNAQVYLDSDAIIVLDETKLDSDKHSLFIAVQALLDDADKQRQMKSAISRFAKPTAARDVAELIAGLLESDDIKH